MPLINCPECSKQISDQTNACPHCGYPLKSSAPPFSNTPQPFSETVKPAEKKGFSIISFLAKSFVAIIVFSLVYSCATSNEYKESVANNSNSSRAVSKENVQIEATAQQIINEYQNNEVRGDALIKDKIVKVTGIVTDITSDFSDRAVVSLGSNVDELNFFHVMASGDTAFHNKAIDLRKGQKVTLICRGDGEVIGSPQLSKCIFD